MASRFESDIRFQKYRPDSKILSHSDLRRCLNAKMACRPAFEFGNNVSSKITVILTYQLKFDLYEENNKIVTEYGYCPFVQLLIIHVRNFHVFVPTIRGI